MALFRDHASLFYALTFPFLFQHPLLLLFYLLFFALGLFSEARLFGRLGQSCGSLLFSLVSFLLQPEGALLSGFFSPCFFPGEL